MSKYPILINVKLSTSPFTNRVNVPHEHVVSSMSIRYDPLAPSERKDTPGKSKGREMRTQRVRDSRGGIGEAVLVAVGVAIATALVLFVGYDIRYSLKMKYVTTKS